MKTNDILKPIASLVLYSNKDLNRLSNYSYSSSISAEDVYIEYLAINNGIPDAAIPLSGEVSKKIGRVLNSKADLKVGGFVPSNVIYSSFNGLHPVLAWYTKPAEKRILHKNVSKALLIKTPWLVWIYNKNLHVYACEKKPNAKTEMFHAPFCNISEDGEVCLGAASNIITDDVTNFKSIIESAEMAFYGSTFTHESFEGTKTNLISLYKKLNVSKEPFPVDVLKEYSLSLSELIQKYHEQDKKYKINEDDEINEDNEDEED